MIAAEASSNINPGAWWKKFSINSRIIAILSPFGFVQADVITEPIEQQMQKESHHKNRPPHQQIAGQIFAHVRPQKNETADDIIGLVPRHKGRAGRQVEPPFDKRRGQIPRHRAAGKSKLLKAAIKKKIAGKALKFWILIVFAMMSAKIMGLEVVAGFLGKIALAGVCFFAAVFVYFAAVIATNLWRSKSFRAKAIVGKFAGRIRKMAGRFKKKATGV